MSRRESVSAEWRNTQHPQGVATLRKSAQFARLNEGP